MSYRNQQIDIPEPASEPPAGYYYELRDARLIKPGDVFGRLTVISRGKPDRHHHSRWICRCTCGMETNSHASALGRRTRSCGCLGAENRRASLTTHHQSATSEYLIWRGIKSRCLNPHVSSYPSYGGSGITICKEWSESFQSFYACVGPRPSPQLTIDRIDNSRGYEPGNVRWATRLQQVNNRNCSKNVTVDGATLTLVEWSHLTGISYWTLRSRYDRGADIGVRGAIK